MPRGHTDSASWGIEFEITDEMYQAVKEGGEMNVLFDWSAQDTSQVDGLGGSPPPSNGGTEEPSYVKARFSSATASEYLGEELGGDSAPEVFFAPSAVNQVPWGWPRPVRLLPARRQAPRSPSR